MAVLRNPAPTKLIHTHGKHPNTNSPAVTSHLICLNSAQLQVLINSCEKQRARRYLHHQQKIHSLVHIRDRTTRSEESVYHRRQQIRYKHKSLQNPGWTRGKELECVSHVCEIKAGLPVPGGRQKHAVLCLPFLPARG